MYHVYMGKGSGSSSCRPALQIGGLADATIVINDETTNIHPSVPDNLRHYLLETDGAKLTKALDKATSYPEYQTIVFRLAQLRDEYAVAGLMSSEDYKKAKKKYDDAVSELEAAKKALAKAEDKKGSWQPTEEELQSIQRRVFGESWQAKIAEAELQKHPDWISLQMQLKHTLENENKRTEKKAKSSGENSKEIKELDKKIRLLMIRKGALSPEVKELKKQRKALLAEAPVEEVEDVKDSEVLRQQLLQLQKTLLGEKMLSEDGEQYFYKGGQLDIEDAVEEYKIEREVEVEQAIKEEQLKKSLSGNTKERNRVIRAERALSEGNHDMLVHEAAIKRAKKRAEIAKKKQLVFESQAVNMAFNKELQSRPLQTRAVFLENSMFKDHLVNMAFDKDKKTYEITAEISPGMDEKKLMEALGGKEHKYNLDLPANYGSWAQSKLNSIYAKQLKEDGVTITYTPVKPIKGNEAVKSEQGVLRVTGSNSKKMIEKLQEKGLTKGVCQQVPYDAIYRGDHRFGNVSPLYEPLATGQAALEVPDGHMIIHGLTGVSGGKDAVNRLENIIKTGGLKSIAERRRMGITGMTMSPLGDIASGIDMGVPCKIGDSTTYGGSIFLGMNPEALSRRDLWFSDRDFGGGHDRHPEYLAYAKKLGQKDLHAPCPVEGRQKHLKKGLGNTNEVYFKNEISWNDVDTLFVEKSIGSEVISRINKYKSEGLLPKHVRVAVVGDAPEGFKKPKSAAGKSTSKAFASGWTVTEDGNVVLAESMEDAQSASEAPANWDINAHIKYRAREIARTME